MKLLERLRAVTSIEDLWDTDLDEAIESENSAEAVPAALALLEHHIPRAGEDDRGCFDALVDYVERCSTNGSCDPQTLSAAVAESLERTPSQEFLELLLKIAAPSAAASSVLRLLETDPIDPGPRELACALAELVEAHEAALDPGLLEAIRSALADAFEPVVRFTHTPEDLCAQFRCQRHDREAGEFYQEELSLHGGGFTYVDRWVGCHDATRDTRRGTWCVWLTAPERSAHAEFVERFGPRPLARHRIKPFPGYDATDALVERIGVTSVRQETHMDIQDGDVHGPERKVRQGRGIVMRVYVDRGSGALALAGDLGLLRQYDDNDDDDDWLLY